MTSRKRSEKRRLDSIVSVRFSPAEVEELRRRARLMGMSMSGYLRYITLQPKTFSNVNPATVTVAGPVIVHYSETRP